MEQVKLKMSENCEQMYNTLLKGCGLTREDINETYYDYDCNDWTALQYTRHEDYISIGFYLMYLVDLMSSINYRFMYCGEQAFHVMLMDDYWDLANEECLQFVNDNKFQMVFGILENAIFSPMVVFEVSTYDCPIYYIDRIIFMDNSGNTVLFENNKGFITTQAQTAPAEEQSNSTNNKDLETRVNNIEEKLDTLIKMISK